MKKILITGGTGSWGHRLLANILLKYKDIEEVIIFSRGELAQVNMRLLYPDKKIKFIIGDVRDYFALNSALRGVDTVFHLAALKHVPVCELQPQEAIKTNILGTQNLVNACLEQDVKNCILVSTDKAVAPTNLYGMTKSIAEKLIIQANLISDKTNFVCIRAGNVIGSNGSIVPLFIHQMETQRRITVTDPEMTRFFMTLDGAIKLLLTAFEQSKRGETWVLKMPSFTLQEVINAIIRYRGFSSLNIKQDIIGRRLGEKKHEVLISADETCRTREIESFFVISPEYEKTFNFNNARKQYDSSNSLYDISFEKMLKEARY